MGKIAQVNLELGMPTVEQAMQKLKNSLLSNKIQGYKAVIVIHGYGSTGVGGRIKAATIKCLGESSMRGIVRAKVGGEQWSARKREFLGMCKGLEEYRRTIENNQGVTLVILK